MILELNDTLVDLSKPLFTIDLRRDKNVVGGKLVDGLDLSWRMFTNRTEAENCREMLEHAVRKAIGVPSVEDWPEAGTVAVPTPEAARYREFLERAVGTASVQCPKCGDGPSDCNCPDPSIAADQKENVRRTLGATERRMGK